MMTEPDSPQGYATVCLELLKQQGVMYVPFLYGQKEAEIVHLLARLFEAAMTDGALCPSESWVSEDPGLHAAYKKTVMDKVRVKKQLEEKRAALREVEEEARRLGVLDK